MARPASDSTRESRPVAQGYSALCGFLFLSCSGAASGDATTPQRGDPGDVTSPTSVADSNWSDTASSQRTGTHTDLGAPRPLPCEAWCGAPGRRLAGATACCASSSPRRRRRARAIACKTRPSRCYLRPCSTRRERARERRQHRTQDVLDVAVLQASSMLTLRDVLGRWPGWGTPLPPWFSAGAVPSDSIRSARAGRDARVHLRFESEVPALELTARRSRRRSHLERTGAVGQRVPRVPDFPGRSTPRSPRGFARARGLAGDAAGVLYLGFDGPVDLRACLSQLTRVCGLFSLSSTAPPGSETTGSNRRAVAGRLESLEVSGRVCTSASRGAQLASLGACAGIQRPDVENDCAWAVSPPYSALQD
jgi:hypothetical protein